MHKTFSRHILKTFGRHILKTFTRSSHAWSCINIYSRDSISFARTYKFR